MIDQISVRLPLLRELLGNMCIAIVCFPGCDGSSLLYNTSDIHERLECNMNDTSATRTTRVQNEWDTSDTATRVLHECDTNEKFWFS